MTEEKPLHVRVAEALGCRPVQPTDPTARRWAEQEGWWGACWCSGDEKGPHSEPWGALATLARYDTDWAATGPLIERYNICVYPSDGMWEACWTSPSLVRCQSCESSKSERYDGDGPTPLVAVCSLILALKERGKL